MSRQLGQYREMVDEEREDEIDDRGRNLTERRHRKPAPMMENATINYDLSASSSSIGNIIRPTEHSCDQIVDNQPVNSDSVENSDVDSSRRTSNEAADRSMKECYHQQLIEQMHPLRQKKFHEIFPVINYFNKLKDRHSSIQPQRTSDRRSSLKPSNFIEQAGAAGHRALQQIENLTLKNKYLHSFAKQSNKVLYRIHSSDDPMKELGPGISAYHQMLVTLFVLFLILFLFHLPVMSIYSSYKYYDGDKDVGFYITHSLGNMGFSKTECQAKPLIQGNKFKLKCRTGSIESLVDWGIVTRFEDQFQCQRKTDNYCNSFLQNESFKNMFDRNCRGQRSCEFKDFQNFVHTKSEGSKTCTDKQSRFFIQYMCKQQEFEINEKMANAAKCIYIEIISAIIVVGFTVLSTNWTKDLAKRYDEDTVTPSDYTLFFKIQPSQSDIFDKILYKQNLSDSSRGQQFKEWMTHQLSLFKHDDLVKIVRTDLVFDNGRMIKLLKRRGEAIKNNDSGRVFQTEHMIKILKQEQYHARICGAFVTFENDKDVKTAKMICQKTKLQIFGKPVSLKRSEEPSNYIWENLGTTKKEQRVNRCYVILLLVVILSVAYNLQYVMQKSVQNVDKYERIDCHLYSDRIKSQEEPSDEALRQEYLLGNVPKQKEGTFTRMDFQKEAFQTWKNFYDPADSDSKSQLVTYVNGTLGCFCEQQYQAKGLSTIYQYYRKDGLDQLPPFIYKVIESREQQANIDVDQEQICKQFVIYEKFRSVYYWLMSFSIIIYNGFFYTLVVPLVKMIRFHKKTDENWLQCFILFTCLALDMILLPIFIGMNLVEADNYKISSSIFTGKHTDFDGDWYKDIGQQIMLTMTIFAFQPVIDYLVELLILKSYRFYHRNFTYSLKSKSEQGKMNVQNDFLVFMDMHAGPEYPFYLKFSNTNLVVFICIVFGGSMPMLFAIGMLAIAIQYFMDRLALTYFYRLPPKFGEQLNITSLKLMSVAPVIGLCILLWQYTNRQMFANAIDKISTQNQVTLSHHFLKDLNWYSLKYCQKALVTFVCLITIFLVIQEVVRVYKKKFKPKDKLKIQESVLPNYYTSLRLEAIDELLEDERQFKAFGFANFEKNGLNNLENQRAKKITQMATHDHRHDFENGIVRAAGHEGVPFNICEQHDVMIGSPCFQAYRCLDYQMQFNNQNTGDEIHTRLLLNLPMVPKKYHDKIVLNHLKLYQAKSSQQSFAQDDSLVLKGQKHHGERLHGHDVSDNDVSTQYQSKNKSQTRY